MSKMKADTQAETGDVGHLKRRKQADRFRRSVEALVRSHRGFVTLGRAATIDDLARKCGIDELDYCQFEIKLKGRELCLLFVPQHLWHRPDTMERFGQLKAAARPLGHQVLLVPEALVRRSAQVSRFDESFEELDLEVSGTDRMSVISFLACNGGGTLSQVAGLLDPPPPVAAVLRLATIGAIHIDLDASILPATEVNFPAQVH